MGERLDTEGGKRHERRGGVTMAHQGVRCSGGGADGPCSPGQLSQGAGVQVSHQVVSVGVLRCAWWCAPWFAWASWAMCCVELLQTAYWLHS